MIKRLLTLLAGAWLLTAEAWASPRLQLDKPARNSLYDNNYNSFSYGYGYGYGMSTPRISDLVSPPPLPVESYKPRSPAVLKAPVPHFPNKYYHTVAYEAPHALTEAKVTLKNLMVCMDFNRDGVLQLEDFANTIRAEVSKETLKALVLRLDSDKDGTLQLWDILLILHSGPDYLKELFQTFGTLVDDLDIATLCGQTGDQLLSALMKLLELEPSQILQALY